MTRDKKPKKVWQRGEKAYLLFFIAVHICWGLYIAWVLDWI
jgi:hypothetical protein